MKRSVFILLMCILLGVFSATANASVLDPKPALDAYTLIAEVNALRAANGLYPYEINATLMVIAQAHTQYQANTGTVTHYSADGSRPFQRALAAGYPVGGDLSLGGFFSENITAGTNKTPAQAIVEWQGDAAHLNTMLSTHLTEIGAGVVDMNGYIYYTIDAGMPSSGTVPVYSSPAPGETAVSGGALPTLDWIMPVITSTPNDAGEVIHEVQVGQSLWGIADVYGTTVQEIRRLNNMSVEEAIYPGENLLIRVEEIVEPPTLTVVSTQEPIFTQKVILTETSIPTRESTMPPVIEESEEIPAQTDSALTVMIIALSALVLAGLVTWLSSRSSD